MIRGSLKPCFLGQKDIEMLSNLLEIGTAKFNQKICDEFAWESQTYNINKAQLQFFQQDTVSQQKKKLEKLKSYADKLFECLKSIDSYTKTKIIDIATISDSQIFERYETNNKKLIDSDSLIESFRNDINELSKYASIVKQNLKTQPGPRKKRVSLRSYILYLYDLFEHLTGEKPPHRNFAIYSECYDGIFFKFVDECLRVIGEDIKESTLSAQVEEVFKSKVITSQK